MWVQDTKYAQFVISIFSSLWCRLGRRVCGWFARGLGAGEAVETRRDTQNAALVQFRFNQQQKIVLDVDPKPSSQKGFAMQAFGIATLITVSGYVALLVIVSELMGVNTFKEFGRRTTYMFGDRFRISRGGGAGENYTSLTELFEALQQQQQKKDGESK
jgi:hypothetical protein